MEPQDQDVATVLGCANRAAGTALTLPGGAGDLLLEEFGFDSLSLFAFVLELERAFGAPLDDALLDHEHLRSVRSAAALMAAEVARQHGSQGAGDVTPAGQPAGA